MGIGVGRRSEWVLAVHVVIAVAAVVGGHIVGLRLAGSITSGGNRPEAKVARRAWAGRVKFSGLFVGGGSWMMRGCGGCERGCGQG